MSPEKATGSQETAPLPDCSQKIFTVQSQSSCSALLTPHPSSEARSREGGPGWLTSSLIVFQTMGKVPLSQIRDLQHHRPKLGWEGGGAVGKEADSRTRCPQEPKDRRAWGKCWGAERIRQRCPDSPCYPFLDTGPTVKGRNTCQQVPAPAHREAVKPLLHTGRSCVCLWRRQTLSQAAPQVPCQIRA